ncbi:Heme utilization protein [Pseudomonas yamanorum]
MKTTMALKPLAFALAAIVASAAHAGGYHHPQPAPTSVVAAVSDAQSTSSNKVLNLGTQNNASANNSLNGSSGNAQANIAAGDGNQQDNQTAIAAGDAATVFALGTITQDNHNNTSIQVATHNNASLNNSANGSSGNLGVNAASGNFNQQKNQLAIATASGAAAAASSNTTQTSVDNTFLNTVATQSGHWGSTTYLPVVNNASANNSLNGSSGNLGANIAAGVGNQQGNTTVISSGVRF